MCYNFCKVDAIDEEINLIKESCEGCGVCEYMCSVDAIEMVDRDSGFSYISVTRFGPMTHEMLKTAEEASGKLVTVVRNNAKKLAEEGKKDLIIIDGPPGIGCPVISSISGVDLVLIVTEPTLSGLHDLGRVVDVAKHFGIPGLVCINKWDLNPDVTSEIEREAQKRGLGVAGRVRYDRAVTDAQIRRLSVVECQQNGSGQDVRRLWAFVIRRLSKVERHA